MTSEHIWLDTPALVCLILSLHLLGVDALDADPPIACDWEYKSLPNESG